ncbi:MAG: FHA domain-containing protein [Chloroflexi bacterium CFX4]|nr:FHA domain-containing protein [Chloroflexi bacterium CFX4]MDL1924603.1 FHA domain-containing protein [Chloroflexi bacterium CFX3]
MTALLVAILCLAAGLALRAVPELSVPRAALYAAGAASAAYWLLRRLPPRLITPTEPDAPPARLIVVDGAPRLLGKRLPIAEGSTPLGSAFGLALRGTPTLLSPTHCTLQHTANGYTLTDHGTPNGTYLNGRRLLPATPATLHSGDEITLGDPQRGGVVLRFYAPLFSSTPATPAETLQTAPAVGSTPETLAALAESLFASNITAMSSARRTSVMPLVLPSPAEQAPPPDTAPSEEQPPHAR